MKEVVGGGVVKFGADIVGGVYVEDGFLVMKPNVITSSRKN